MCGCNVMPLCVAKVCVYVCVCVYVWLQWDATVCGYGVCVCVCMCVYVWLQCDATVRDCKVTLLSS
jgi:hypothetical protein